MPSSKPTLLFWILGIVFLLWNAFGCFMYLADQMASDETWRAMENGEAILAAKALYPIWAVIAYALAVWGGLIAAILLLLRKKLAIPLFVISFVAAIICFIPSFTIDEMKAAGGDTYWIMPMVVLVIGLIEIWWSFRKRADGTIA
tara:strand:+ start:479 stop:913 length:435 start_codon:yes stop_codon:yes gene_type:complete